MRADLTVSCDSADNSDRRMHWVVFAILSLVIYMLGGASVLPLVIYTYCAVITRSRPCLGFCSTYFDLSDHVSPPTRNRKIGRGVTSTQREPWYKHDISAICQVQARAKLRRGSYSRNGLVATQIREIHAELLVLWCWAVSRAPHSDEPDGVGTDAARSSCISQPLHACHMLVVARTVSNAA